MRIPDDAKDRFAPYRKLRDRYWQLLARALLLLLGIVAAGCLLPAGLVRNFGAPIAAAWYGWTCMHAMATWWKLLRWPCPECGKPFIRTWWSTWRTNHCKHCGASAYLDREGVVMRLT
jgi:hypothetical protein